MATFARAVVVVPAAVAAVGGRAVHLLADAVAAAPEPLDARACARRHDITRFTTSAKKPTTMGSYSMRYSALTGTRHRTRRVPGMPGCVKRSFQNRPLPLVVSGNRHPLPVPF